MDIFTHIVSGLAASTMVVAFTKDRTATVSRILGAGALGGAFPDIDTISLWSKFDIIIGEGLGLAHPGKEIYFAKFWYSHHAFFHSITAAVMVGFIFGCLAFLNHITQWQQKKETFSDFFKINRPVYLAFVLGCLAHITGDLFTPPGTWGGVRLFYPLEVYVGGMGCIWWWNNYDIFFIICTGTLLNLILISIVTKHYRRIRIMTAVIATLIIFGVWYEGATRTNGYACAENVHTYQQLEQKSKEEQQRILGEKLYQIVEKFDDWLAINF